MADNGASIAIPAGLVEAIAGYLADRPYREVAHLLAALQVAVRSAVREPMPPDSTPLPDGTPHSAGPMTASTTL